ncbi:sodium/glutamate symporter [Methanolobus sp. ZRKC3]|uniref:sodium/glutamate symporter n=1 Tax=Methanolobus sp. ZRKC3 TaxID=3125786 RepID=UPI00325233A0
MLLELDMIQTISLAVVMLYLGSFLVKKIKILDRLCIPTPVVGGVVFAIACLFLKQGDILLIELDSTLRNFMMIAFFTSIGFTASLGKLRKGGSQVFMFLILAATLVTLQNVVSLSVAKYLDINMLLGLSTGSAPMTGGHGTSLAFAPLMEDAGAIGASTIAMAAATFGLITGSMIGGPIARRLIQKHDLLRDREIVDNLQKDETETKKAFMEPRNFMTASSQILLAMGIGTIISAILQNAGLTFPSYIGAMFAGAIMRNISDLMQTVDVKMNEISIFGDIALALFLTMALMELKLWQLAELAGPLSAILIAQALLMATFAYFVTFNIMGRDYEAAVLAGGHCGFGMGATPNALANMEAITKKYGPAPSAFIIIPLVGSLFIDFFNAGVITFFLNLLT